MNSNKKRGEYGESTTCKILESFNFKILERNYFSRYGEIDIIALRNKVIHFIEVKTTFGEYNPAENFHKTKFKRFLKTVRIYCYKNKVSEECIQIDLALVNMKHRRFRFIKNINTYFY